MITGKATAQSLNEAPVAESCANDAVARYDYGIENPMLTSLVIAVASAVDHLPGIGFGHRGWGV